MSENPPSGEEGSATSGKPPSNESQGYGPIADAIQAFRKDYEADGAKQQARHDENMTWQKRTTIGVGAYTLLTVILVFLSKCTLDSNTVENAQTMRAWIDASSVAPNNVPGPGTNTFVQYTNAGREPAFGIAGGASAKIAYIADEGKDWDRNSVWPSLGYLREKTMCEGVHPQSGREVIFPQVNGGGTVMGSFPVHFDPAEWGPIQNAQPPLHFVVVYGCLAYTSPVMDGERTTGFCYYWPPTPIPGQSPPYRCPTGNYAE